MSNTFRFGALELPYLPHRDGEHIGERRIEVPIAVVWASMRHAHTEVGAVLPYHLDLMTGDDIVDPYDPHPAVTHRVDAETFDFSGRNVLSISTLEHIGQGEYGGEAFDLHKASRVLQKIVRESQTYLITVPLGYHAALDAYIAGSGLPMRFMRQTSPDNHWEACGEEYLAKSVYNHPYPYANVVAFISNSFDWAEGASS
jgi:hypothetical protein